MVFRIFQKTPNFISLSFLHFPFQIRKTRIRDSSVWLFFLCRKDEEHRNLRRIVHNHLRLKQRKQIRSQQKNENTHRYKPMREDKEWPYQTRPNFRVLSTNHTFPELCNGHSDCGFHPCKRNPNPRNPDDRSLSLSLDSLWLRCVRSLSLLYKDFGAQVCERAADFGQPNFETCD